MPARPVYKQTDEKGVQSEFAVAEVVAAEKKDVAVEAVEVKVKKEMVTTGTDATPMEEMDEGFVVPILQKPAMRTNSIVTDPMEDESDEFVHVPVENHKANGLANGVSSKHINGIADGIKGEEENEVCTTILLVKFAALNKSTMCLRKSGRN